MSLATGQLLEWWKVPVLRAFSVLDKAQYGKSFPVVIPVYQSIIMFATSYLINPQRPFVLLTSKPLKQACCKRWQALRHLLYQRSPQWLLSPMILFHQHSNFFQFNTPLPHIGTKHFSDHENRRALAVTLTNLLQKCIMQSQSHSHSTSISTAISHQQSPLCRR